MSLKNLTAEQAAYGSTYKTANLLTDLDGNFSELDTVKADSDNPVLTGSVTVPTPVLSSEAATKGYIDNLIAILSGGGGIDSIEDVVAVLPNGIPLGEKYILSTDNHIYTSNGDNTWTDNGLSDTGTVIYVKTDVSAPANDLGFHNFDGVDWIVMGAMGNHNDLSNIDGGEAGYRGHLTATQHTIATQTATTSQDGYLNQTDWDTFNNKAPTNNPIFTGIVVVPNDSFAYTKLQDVSVTDRVLGRSSAGAGDIEEIPCTAAGRSIIGATALIDQKIYLNINNIDNTSDVNKPISTATSSALALKAPIASPTFTGTVSGITKSMVGLGNVDNTSDANKPVSTATQSALNLKANIASPTLTGVPAAPTAVPGTNTTQIATTAFVQTALSGGSTLSATLTHNTTTNVTIGDKTTDGLIVIHFRAARGTDYQVGYVEVLNQLVDTDENYQHFGSDLGITSLTSDISGNNLRLNIAVDNSSVNDITFKYILIKVTL